MYTYFLIALESIVYSNLQYLFLLQFSDIIPVFAMEIAKIYSATTSLQVGSFQESENLSKGKGNQWKEKINVEKGIHIKKSESIGLLSYFFYEWTRIKIHIWIGKTKK